MTGRKKDKINKVIIISTAIAVIALAVIAVVIINIYMSGTRLTDDTPVLTVNGAEITFREFKLFIDSNRATVISKFQTRYNEDSAGFWNRTDNADDPIDFLLESALDASVRAKIQQLLALENGLIDDVSYRSFLSQLEDENRRRAEAVKNNEVIFGPEVYSEVFFYLYLLDDYQQKLKLLDSIKGSFQIRPSEAEIIGFFEDNKENMFKAPDAITVDFIYIPYMILGQETVHSRDEARMIIDEAALQIQRGLEFNTIASHISENESLQSNTGSRVFDSDSFSMDSRYEGGLREFVEELRTGQISDVFEYQDMLGNVGFYLFKCVSIESEGFLPFEEVRELIYLLRLNINFAELIDRLQREAVIVLKDSFYSITSEEIDG